MIEVLVTTDNKVVIDPTVEIISNSPNQQLHFKFQAPWGEGCDLYAVFKCVFDTPVRVQLDENNCCTVPTLKYNKYMKVGVALVAVDILTDTIVLATSYNYVKVVRGATIPEFAPSSANGTHRYETDDDSFTLTKGDTYDTKLLLAGVDDYSVIEKVTFISTSAGVTKDLTWDITQQAYRLIFTSEETSAMRIGTFTYDIVVKFTDGDQITVISNENFTIK